MSYTANNRGRAARWLGLYAPALLGMWLISGTAHALDCWIPTVDSTQPQYRDDPLPNIRAVIATGEQIARDNAHFKAMPRPIRIRARISAGPSHGQVNVVAYRPDVWEGSCDVVPGADRCCTDGAINLMVNSPESLLPPPSYVDAGKTRVYRQPKRTGTVAGFPEFAGHVVLSLNDRMPWLSVTVGEYIDAEEHRELATQEKMRRERPAVYGMDPAVVRKAYENTKKIDAKSAEQYRATMEAQMGPLAEQQRKLWEKADRLATERLAGIRQARASLTPAQLAAQAHEGDGTPHGLTRPEDPRAIPMVKDDPDFPDRRDPDRVQLMSVFVGVVPNDEVLVRRDTMQRTKDTYDYARLAKLLR